MKTKRKIIPVLLGADLNAYSMARAFFEAEGVRCHLFARERLAISALSRFSEMHVVPGLDDPDVAVPALMEFGRARADADLLLVPCADWYAEMLEYSRDKLRGHFYFNIPDFEVWRAVSEKASFLSLLAKLNISAPISAVVRSGSFEAALSRVPAPYVVKPADSTEYWRFRFEGMKKVFFPKTRAEALEAIRKIESSGYRGRILIQERIGASEKPKSSVLTTYSTSDGRVVRAVLGRILLLEKGDTSFGNYAAIVTEKLDETSRELIALLDKIKYTGIANFDIISYQEKSYCLELNARQGRSSDYVRAAGVNLAELLLADMRGEKIEECFDYREIFWRSAPRSAVINHADDEKLLEKAMSLSRLGLEFTPFSSKEDAFLLRRAYLFLHSLKQSVRINKDERLWKNASL
jgi:D-aspartate ligase